MTYKLVFAVGTNPLHMTSNITREKFKHIIKDFVYLKNNPYKFKPDTLYLHLKDII